MDQIFDRLGTLLRSMFLSGDSGGERRAHTGDPDFDDAWDELDAFLRYEKPGDGSSGQRRSASGARSSSQGSGAYGSGSAGQGRGSSEDLRQDYANLGVQQGASMEQVRKAYKDLLRQYHPDKFAADPEKLKFATELTQRLNVSYKRIRDSMEKGK